MLINEAGGGTLIYNLHLVWPCFVLLGVHGITHDSVSSRCQIQREFGGSAKTLIISLVVERLTCSERVIVSSST